MIKSALTQLPLSPDETYNASQLFGRSLFSALQLAQEQELRKKLEARNSFSGEDEKVLRIPIPAGLMPSQKEAAEHTYSVIEHPDGKLEYDKTRSERAHTDKGFTQRNSGAIAGTLVGTAGGMPGALIGSAVGMAADAGPAHGGMEYVKTITHLDGSREHIFNLKKNPGAGEHIKRNIGKYLGTAAGLTAGRALPGKLRALALPLAGLSAGHAFDKYTKDTDLENIATSPEAQADMLTDLQFRKKILSDKLGEDSGVFQQALGGLTDHPVRMLVGGQQGFRDAKQDFYFKQKEQIQKELMAAQKEYIDLLSRIKTGSAEEYDNTPCVDAFCNGIAHAVLFGKTASNREVNIEDDSLSRLMGDVANAATYPFKPAASYAATGLLGTGAGSAYLTYLLRKKMREEPDKYMEDHLPTRVELQPYN